jgi:hypothetical protein
MQDEMFALQPDAISLFLTVHSRTGIVCLEVRLSNGAAQRV